MCELDSVLAGWRLLLKAVLKTHAVQTLRECRASPNRAERLECGVFTAAFRL